MSMEEQDLLRSAVREFAQKSIQDKALKIEREGIDDTLLKALAAQGFLAARIPEKLGGSGIDTAGYLAILEELAYFSPSVAALVMMTNSIAAPLIGEKDPDTVAKLAAGELRVAVSLAPALEGNTAVNSVKKSGTSLKGSVEHAAFSNGMNAVFLSQDDNTLYLSRRGVSAGEQDQGLSFRGLNFGTVNIDSSEFEVLSNDGLKALKTVLDNSDLEVAAIALGIAKGAIEKAIEYVKVRKTFERPLKDYGPVSSSLSRLLAEQQLLSSHLGNMDLNNQKEKLMIKVLAVDLAKRASKYSLQYHGGYGYIEDFGVEKFYRDAMGLSILFQRPHADSQRLAEEIFGEKSGYL